MARVVTFRVELERAGGIPIHVHSDAAGLNEISELTSGWTADQPQREHVINIGPQHEYQKPYALARALILIEMELEAVRARSLFHPRACTELIVKRFGLNSVGSEAQEFMPDIQQIVVLLKRVPVDMLVETRLRQRFPELAPAQQLRELFHGLFRAQCVQNVADPRVRVQPLYRRSYRALEGATSLFWADLLKWNPHRDFYAAQSTRKLSEKIFQTFQRHPQKPGTEHQLIDEVAALVGLEGAFEWDPVNVTLPTTGIS